MRKWVFTMIAACGCVCSSLAQSYPYAINDWKEPGFKKRFLGSYGVSSSIQPELNVDSYNLAEGVYSLMDTPQLAVDYINQGVETMKTQGVKPSPGINFLKGNLYYEMGKLELATKEYIEALTEFPTYKNAYMNLGLTFMEMGKEEDALPMLLKAVEFGANESQTHGLIGFCYLNQGLYGSAEVSFQTALTFDPRYEPWRMGLLNSLILQQRFDEAVPMAEELLYLNPGDATHWRNMASLYMRNGAFEKAISHFEGAHRLGGAVFESREQLSYLYFNMKLFGEAAREFQSAIGLAEGYEQLQKAMAFCVRLSVAGEYESVRLLVAEIESRSSEVGVPVDSWSLQFLRAGTLMDEERYEEVEDSLKALLKERPSSGEVALYLARVYKETDRDALAVTYFEIAEKSKESAYQAYFEHGTLLIGQRRIGEALIKFEQAQRISPRDSLARYIERLRKADTVE